MATATLHSNSTFKECLEVAQNSLKDVKLTHYEKYVKGKNKLRVVEIGYIDGIKKVTIRR